MGFTGSSHVSSPPAESEQPPLIQAPQTGQQLGVQLGKTRSPALVWLLTVVTLGVYTLVWYYKINTELRDYNGRVAVSPALALCNISVFGLLSVGVSAVVSFVRTGARIHRAMAFTYAGRCSGAAGILLQCFVFGVGVVYYQRCLNRVWASHGQT